MGISGKYWESMVIEMGENGPSKNFQKKTKRAKKMRRKKKRRRRR